MNFNEITYLLIGCWISLALVWLYFKFITRNFPTFKQALALYGESSKNLAILVEEQIQYLDKSVTDLIQERDKLLEDYDEPDKTLH